VGPLLPRDGQAGEIQGVDLITTAPDIVWVLPAGFASPILWSLSRQFARRPLWTGQTVFSR